MTDARHRSLVRGAALLSAVVVTGAIAGELNLEEANVTGVKIDPQENRTYRFNVTLHHDDDGEDGYADRWQVESLNGEELGRRELAHPHGTRAFTRSTTIELPEGSRYVVIRGHDQTHGFGGRAAIVDFETGGVDYVDQGPERQNLRDDVERKE